MGDPISCTLLRSAPTMTNQNILFRICSVEEAAKFEERLCKSEQSKWHRRLTELSLPNAYEQFEGDKNGARLFAAFFDLRLASSMSNEEVYGFGPNWFEYFFSTQIDGRGVLDSEEEFEAKLKSYGHQTAFILRFRALLDKIMGFLVLLKTPEEYDRFVSSRSRKKAFGKLFDALELDPEILKSIDTSVEVIDSNFRTAEAHGTGVLRRHVFQVNALDSEHRDILLIQWKAVTDVVNKLPTIIEDWHAKKKA